jgi:hypothetical protein
VYNTPTLPHATSPRSPALASFQGRLYLAWKGEGNNDLNVACSADNGRTFPQKYTSKETSQDAPALCMLGSNNALYLGWKGNGNANLNAAQVQTQGNAITGLAGKVLIPEDPSTTGASPSGDALSPGR